MSFRIHTAKQLRYKTWVNDITFEALANVPEHELHKERKTTFKTILATLNHIYVVDDIFKSHLIGANHQYTFRNTESIPSLHELHEKQHLMDLWLQAYVEQCDEDHLRQEIRFEYIGGGNGVMSVFDILQHLTNHGTYHHGFVSDMMYQIPAIPPASDYTVFLRDVES